MFVHCFQSKHLTAPGRDLGASSEPQGNSSKCLAQRGQRLCPQVASPSCPPRGCLPLSGAPKRGPAHHTTGGSSTPLPNAFISGADRCFCRAFPAWRHPTLERGGTRGTGRLEAQSVGRPNANQVVISPFVGSSPTRGSVFSVHSPLQTLCPPLSLSLPACPHSSLSLSLKNKN